MLNTMETILRPVFAGVAVGAWDLNLFSVPGDQFTNNSLFHPPVSGYRLVLHQSDPNVMKLENTNRFLLLTLNQQMHCTLKVKKFMINQ